jgi:hypothetical protein
LQSEHYFDEALTIYHIMKYIWPGKRRIEELFPLTAPRYCCIAQIQYSHSIAEYEVEGKREDKKVKGAQTITTISRHINLWAVGLPHRIKSISHHDAAHAASDRPGAVASRPEDDYGVFLDHNRDRDPQ